MSAKREKTLRKARRAEAQQTPTHGPASGAAMPVTVQPTSLLPVRADPISLAVVSSPKVPSQSAPLPISATHRPTGATQLAARRPAARFGAFLESAQQEILAVTYWFDPPPVRGTSSVRIRFSGRRTGLGARSGPRDQFVCHETVDDVTERSGRVSVTAKVRDVEPGEWVVSARVVAQFGGSGVRNVSAPAVAHHALQLHPAAWSWRRWSLHDRQDETIATCLAPAVKVPALIPFSWGPMVLVGVLLGLLLQVMIVASHHLSVGRVLAVSIVALIAGAVGAKLWYAVIKRRQGDLNGWCIQGFLLGFTLVAVAMATLLGVVIGTFLDVSAPGIFLGAVAGRLGCFVAGCCGGRPTTSRWGIWSSDQRIGRRRIPTQLVEAGLAAVVSLGSLVAVLTWGPHSGTLFVGSVAAYILVRQGILRLRAERRVSVLLGPLVTVVAAIVLAADVLVPLLRAR